MILINSYLWWDYRNVGLYSRQGKYFPFNSTSDLIEQYNYVGYHDVCIYPTREDMAKYPSGNQIKGVSYVYKGHFVENQTGKELKFVPIRKH